MKKWFNKLGKVFKKTSTTVFKTLKKWFTKFIKVFKQTDTAVFKKESKGKYQNKKVKVNTEQKKGWSRKKKIIFICSGVLLVVIAAGVIYVCDIWSNPLKQFQNVAQQAIAPVETSSVPQMLQTDSPQATVNPYDELLSKADLSILEKTVNIMLIGVDHADERDTWSGKKDFHSDVMIVLSINTETNDVNLVSLPRDTYAKIPGVDGIYKLNASIDCGGGWPNASGFEKVCEAASWMLGGIPVKYYYAVDMGAVKGLVNAIGGVDFNIDLDYTIQERSYRAGEQHMDGQAVLDYLRVRKNLGAESGDLNRIDRQKNMLVAIFDKLKNSNMLTQLPDILAAFDGNLYTNTTFAQTAGLAAFAYKVDSSTIKMHSMDGGYHSIFNWNFVLTNQSERVKLIQQIYGIKVSQRKEYTYETAALLWERMQAEVIEAKSKEILTKVKKKLDADALLPEYPGQISSQAILLTPSIATPAPSTPSPTSIPSSGGYRKYGGDVWALYNKAVAECSVLPTLQTTELLQPANLQLKADIESLCSIFSVEIPEWRVNYEKNSNEIYVDFN